MPFWLDNLLGCAGDLFSHDGVGSGGCCKASKESSGRESESTLENHAMREPQGVVVDLYMDMMCDCELWTV